jgi:hypothetical protein
MISLLITAHLRKRQITKTVMSDNIQVLLKSFRVLCEKILIYFQYNSLSLI